MPDINDHQSEQSYDDGDPLFTVDVDFTAEANRRADDALTALQRLRDAVRREAQAIQDELDTEGDLQKDRNS